MIRSVIVLQESAAINERKFFNYNKSLFLFLFCSNLGNLHWCQPTFGPTPEKGYKDSDSFYPARADIGFSQAFIPVLNEVDKENICALKTFRVFIHSPHEIVTPFHKSILVNYEGKMFTSFANNLLKLFYASCLPLKLIKIIPFQNLSRFAYHPSASWSMRL